MGGHYSGKAGTAADRRVLQLPEKAGTTERARTTERADPIAGLTAVSALSALPAFSGSCSTRLSAVLPAFGVAGTFGERNPASFRLPFKVCKNSLVGGTFPDHLIEENSQRTREF